jgi:hypothetical protein
VITICEATYKPKNDSALGPQGFMAYHAQCHLFSSVQDAREAGATG